jgi:hypothetical protein
LDSACKVIIGVKIARDVLELSNENRNCETKEEEEEVGAEGHERERMNCEG